MMKLFSIYLKLPREISQIACIFIIQWMRFSGGKFENNFFLLLFCKINFCYENFVFMLFTIVTTFTTIVNYLAFCFPGISLLFLLFLLRDLFFRR